MSKNCKIKTAKNIAKLALLGVGTDFALASIYQFLIFSRKSPKNKNVNDNNVPENSILSNSEDVYITSEDGLRLHGFFIPALNHKYAICIHGYGRSFEHMCERLEGISKLDVNIVAVELRGFGKSQGNNFGVGVLDRRDIISWCKWITQLDKEAEIMLYGTSMGGATVMMTVGEPDLPKQVVCAIEDCGYTSFWDQLGYILKNKYKLPPFPLLNTIELINKKVSGYSIKDGPIKSVKKASIPMLFIHGKEDDFVPFYMLNEVYNACSSTIKEKFEVENSGHGLSYKVCPELYWETVKEFVNKFLK